MESWCFASFPISAKTSTLSLRSPYLPIRWRGKTYLASTEDSDLRGFCRAAILAYPRGRSLSARNVYVRKCDEEQEGAGSTSLANFSLVAVRDRGAHVSRR